MFVVFRALISLVGDSDKNALGSEPRMIELNLTVLTLLCGECQGITYFSRS